MGALAGGIAIGSLLLGTGVQMYGAEQANRIRQEQINQRMLQTRLQATQQTLYNQQRLEHVIGMQKAIAGAKGFDPGDASFKAIQDSTFDDYATDERIGHLNELANIDELNDLSAQSRSEATIGDIGAVANFGLGLYQTGLLDDGTTNKVPDLFKTIFGDEDKKKLPMKNLFGVAPTLTRGPEVLPRYR